MHRRLTFFLLFLFLCSGATALVYEVVWSRFLSQMLGSTVYAQTLVLAVFMGGLALGNRLSGRRADLFPHPVRIYGILEIGIGVYGCLFPQVFELADRLFITIGSGLIRHAWALLLVKALFSVLLLLPPTVLMGATLPLVASWLKGRYEDAGRQSALFYSINSIGAVLGAAIAGFYLVQEWGLAGSVLVAGTVNIIIGGTAFLMDRVDFTSPATTAVAAASRTAMPLGNLALIVAATGGISMGLEILASRSLGLVFGSSLQSFAVVLIGFILGIGLGSSVISTLRLKRIASETLVVILLCAAAIWVGLMVIQLESGVELYVAAKAGLARNLTGYAFHQLLTTAFAVVVLGVPAALIGSVLPLLIRTVAPNSESLARTIGKLLTWNTCGAVIGVLLTGFVIMPVFGLRSGFLILCLGLVCAASLLSWKRAPRLSLGLCGGTAAFLLLAFVSGGEQWRIVMGSGVFRWQGGTGMDIHQTMQHRKKHVKLLFYEDAPDATVSVEQGDGIGILPDVTLRINGKADASTSTDMCTQLLSGHLPMLARPDAKDVFVLGFGSGVTAGAVLGHPVTNLVIVDNCAPVFRAGRHFEPWNRGVLTNPITRAIVEDARTVLKLSPKQYDAIITEPSNPWTAGIGSVFTLEFYGAVAKRLKPGGILLQWFHLYENNDALVAMVLRTVGRVFPHMEIWDCGAGDVLIMASQQPWDSSPDAYRSAFNRPEVKSDMKAIGIVSPEALLLRQVASQRTAFAIAHPSGPIQTDMFPILEYEAPKAFFAGAVAPLMNSYDERVRQERNVPEYKRKVLASIKPDEMVQVFARFASNNPELMDAIAWRLDEEKVLTNFKQRQHERSWIAGSKTAPKAPQAAPTDATPAVTNAYYAEWLIETGRVGEGAAIIRNLLATPQDLNWSPATYAAFAAEACMQAGNHQLAGEILLLGLKYAPFDPQLLYLGTIAQRELAMKQERKEISKAN
jgi:spermidine synthase